MFYCKEQSETVFPQEKEPAENGRARKTISMSESKTIAEGLSKYAIGAKLRRLRLRKSMGLLELSKHTGLSPALLSKLERDVMHPTLPTLLRIALVFSVDLDFFFVPEPKPVLEMFQPVLPVLIALGLLAVANITLLILNALGLLPPLWVGTFIVYFALQSLKFRESSGFLLGHSMGGEIASGRQTLYDAPPAVKVFELAGKRR